MPLLLLTRHDVQVDLGLNSELASEANRASAELHRKALGLRGRTGPAVLAARRAIDEEQTNWLNAHLTAPGQLQRLGQIELQWEGPSAMISRPIVAEYLNLTPDQQKKAAAYAAEQKAQRAQAAWTYADHLRLMHKAVSVLSETQKNRWIRLVGRPCRFSISAGAKGAQDQRADREPASRGEVAR
jgi:hypothetical protein